MSLRAEDFAKAMGIILRTLRNREQGRTRPDGAVLALVRIAARGREYCAKISDRCLGTP